MDYCTWKHVSWQISSIRNSLGQQQGLPFVELLTPDMLREVAGQKAVSTETNLHTPGHIVDVPEPSYRSRSFLPAGGGTLVGLANAPRTTCVFRRNWGILQSAGANVGEASSRTGSRDRSETAQQSAGGMALERTPRENRRRHYGDYARYRSESGRISSTGRPKAWAGFPHDTHGRTLLFSHRGRVGRGHGGLFWQRNGRIVAFAFDMGRTARKRGISGRSVVLFVVRDGSVTTAWSGCSVASASESADRFSQGKIAGPTRITWCVGPGLRGPNGWIKKPTIRCRTSWNFENWR